MSPDSGGLWIIHLPNPQTIIEVVHEGEQTHSNNAAFSRVYQHEDERIELRLHHYFTTEFGDEESRAYKQAGDAGADETNAHPFAEDARRRHEVCPHLGRPKSAVGRVQHHHLAASNVRAAGVN